MQTLPPTYAAEPRPDALGRSLGFFRRLGCTVELAPPDEIVVRFPGERPPPADLAAVLNHGVQR